MTIKDLIGYQLVNITNDGIVVTNGTETHTLYICEDYGDCCGYNDVSTKLLVSETELARNPIITNIIKEDDSSSDCETAKVTFFGAYKPLAELNSESGSGSGWCYGACVTLECKALGMCETITSW